MQIVDTTLDQARRAKEKGKLLLGLVEGFAGIGLTRREGQLVVKVNFATAPRDGSTIPSEIDGVPVVLDVVGEIRRQ